MVPPHQTDNIEGVIVSYSSERNSGIVKSTTPGLNNDAVFYSKTLKRAGIKKVSIGAKVKCSIARREGKKAKVMSMELCSQS